MNKRLHVYYSGSVQGVGFRFTAERLAGSLGLAGWVKNLPDGRVEVLCEGREEDLKGFMEKLKKVFREYIDSAEAEWSDPVNEFKDFEVRF
jgi:acylphosphatase